MRAKIIEGRTLVNIGVNRRIVSFSSAPASTDVEDKDQQVPQQLGVPKSRTRKCYLPSYFGKVYVDDMVYSVL